MRKHFISICMILGIIIVQSCKKENSHETNAFQEKLLQSSNWYLKDFKTSPKLEDETMLVNYDEFSINKEVSGRFRVVFFFNGQLIQTLSEATFKNGSSNNFMLDGEFDQMYFSDNNLQCKNRSEWKGKVYELEYVFSSTKSKGKSD